MNTALICLSLSLLILAGCRSNETGPGDPPPVDSLAQRSLATWLEAEAETPERYVVGLFAEHEVVFLGEQHRVKHDALLVQSLLRPLHRAGVHVLATEFGRREDQSLIDSLVQSREWNEELAREILFRQMVFWGYQEYRDIFRSAWLLNRELDREEARFRVLGLNDSPDWSFVRTDSDRDDPAIMRKVWHGEGEEQWAEVILDAVRSGKKVLVHCGIHHAFTAYRQPRVFQGEFRGFDPNLRCGNYVFAALGKRAVTVFLHAPWNGAAGFGAPMIHPAGGVIDALMLARGPRPVGFDLDGGPFGEIRVRDAVYQHGYEDFTLADFCDGWIYRRPISEYEGVTPIAGWVDEDNLERARAQSPNPAFRNASIERFNEAIARDAEIRRRWKHLR